MIYEYAVAPEVASQWGRRENFKFFIREFGLGQGRLVSRFPKKWIRQVWDSYSGSDDMEKKRLEALLSQLKEHAVKRKDLLWDIDCSWQENVQLEHARFPFKAVLVTEKKNDLPDFVDEDALDASPCIVWDIPHGKPVKRVPEDMAKELGILLTHCRWVKFVDPYLSVCRNGYKLSMSTFFGVLGSKRPVDNTETIEVHTSGGYASNDHLRKFYEAIIPKGLTVYFYQWKVRSGGQALHNRFILTDIGGVSFHHGLDAGRKGEIDDITRLDYDQYLSRCNEYDPLYPAFDPAEEVLFLSGKK